MPLEEKIRIQLFCEGGDHHLHLVRSHSERYVTVTGKSGTLETLTGITVTCAEVVTSGFLGTSPTKTATAVTATFKDCKSTGEVCTRRRASQAKS